MRTDAVLLTGFEPYGGRGINSSSEIVRRLDGSTVHGLSIAARTLPVSISGLRERLRSIFAEITPRAVLGLGLWPGETAIRIERIAVNLAAFEIPDNDGAILEDVPLVGGGVAALPARMPFREIEQRLLDAGIPARLSTTAGTFLCNATMYTCLEESGGAASAIPCGFVHVPYLPEQVAALLNEAKKSHAMEIHQRADLASMDLQMMLKAVRIILETMVRMPAETAAPA